jgi:hypothetical protein
MSLFTRLIIRLFQLVFSAKTVFFSHNKSANSVFQPNGAYITIMMAYYIGEDQLASIPSITAHLAYLTLKLIDAAISF